jgi:hypothetical protein
MNSTRPVRDDVTVQTYGAVFHTFLVGYLRFYRAEAAGARLMLAHTLYRSQQLEITDSPFASVFSVMEHIPRESFESLDYVTNVSHLVYATSLLDTFLTETTMFLFLLIPESMGKNQQVPLKTLIEAQSRSAAITLAAAVRAREISYKSFDDRIQFLRDAFGLAVVLDDECEKELQHYSGIRNSAVHDQGIFELRLDDTGQVTHHLKTCKIHPTQLTGKDPFDAAKVYEKVCNTVARAVFVQILKIDPAVIPTFLHEDS